MTIVKTRTAGGAWVTSTLSTRAGGAWVTTAVSGDVTHWVEPFDQATWGNWTKATSNNGTITITPAGHGVLAPVAPDWQTSGSAAYYRPVPAADLDVVARFQIQTVASTSFGVMARVPSSDPLAVTGLTLWVNPDGTCEIAQDATRISAGTPPFAKTDGQWCSARLRVEGTAVSGRLWLDGAAEPGTWTVTATATTRLTAGNVAIRAIGVAGKTVTVDHVIATSPAANTAGAYPYTFPLTLA